VLPEATYVLTIAGVATWGFVTDSTVAILGAVALSLPAGLPALVGYYLAYGFLALVPGANPDTGTGSASCSPDGTCQGSSTGDLAPWFVHATDVIGVLALTAGALLNVALLRYATSKVRSRRP
jgi:hypothetical protein